MYTILQYDLNIFSVFLLVALFILVNYKHHKSDLTQRLFKGIIVMTILMLVFEIFSWLFDGEEGDLNYFLNYFFNFMLTAFSIVVASLWASYIDYMVYGDFNRLKKRMFYSHPAIILMLMTIVNIFVPFMFEITDQNVYTRLPFIWTGVVLSSVIYGFILSMIIIKRKDLNSEILFAIMLFLVLPIIASVLQLTHFGLLLIWPATGLALVFTYLIFETTSSSIDYLTGAYTRRKVDERIKIHLNRGKHFTVIMMDIDDFKEINDEYGHRAGDKVLIEVTSVLKKVFGKKATVSRFGGDEFLVFIDGINKGDVNYFRNEIKRHLGNSEIDYIKNVNLSMGFDFCKSTSTCTADGAITSADNDMFLDKARNKNFKRRSSDSRKDKE